VSFFPAAISGTPDGKQSVSTFKIPSSAIKAMDRVAGIEHTPSKIRFEQPPSSKKSNAFMHTMHTPSKQRSNAVDEAIMSTPVQATSFADQARLEGVDENTGGVENKSEKLNESIYDALGWNDDVDELA
jgi:hypothetical protein